MERRSEPRILAQQPATLKIRGRECTGGIEVTLEDFSARGVRLRTPFPVAENVLIQVETDGLLILGDVCRCVRDAECGEFYYVAVKVAHRLSLLTQLRSLQQSLQDRPLQEPARTRA